MSSLSELFRSLPAPNEIFGFTGAAIENTHHHVGKDVQGRPAVLFRVAAAPVRRLRFFFGICGLNTRCTVALALLAS
jgi:hypothetical protein